MKTRKLLAVLLLVAMCFSFMAVSASADNVIVGGVPASPEIETETGNAPASDAPVAEDDSDESLSLGGFTVEGDSMYDDDTLVSMGTAPSVIPPEYQEMIDNGELTLEEYQNMLALGMKGGAATLAAGDVELISGESHTEYATLQAAIDAAKDGDKIVLHDTEVIDSVYLDITKGVEIDLNSKDIRFIANAKKCENWAAISVSTSADVKIVNGNINIFSTEDNKVVSQFGRPINNANGADLTLENLIFNCEVADQTFTGKNIHCLAGIYNYDPSTTGYVDLTGYTVTASGTDPDILYYVEEANYGAKIGETYYKSFKEAYDAAKDGETVVLLKNATPAFDIEKNITIDLGGKEITTDLKVAADKTVIVKNGTLDNAVVYGTLVLDSKAVCGTVYVQSGASLKINGAEISSFIDTAEGAKLVEINSGNVSQLQGGIDKKNVSIAVGTVFDVAPDSFLPANLYAKETEIEGVKKFVIAAKEASSVDPASASMVEKNAPEEGISFKLGGAANGVKVNGETVSQPSYSVSKDRLTITFAKDYLNGLKPGSYTIEFAVVNSTGIVASLVVEENARLWLEMTQDEFVKGSKTDLVFHCNYEITNPKLDLGSGFETVELKNVIIDNTAKTISLREFYLNSDAFKVGQTYSLNVDTAKGPALASFKVVEDATGVDVRFVDMNGYTPGPIRHFKGEAEQSQNIDTLLKVAPSVKGVKLDGKVLGIENYTTTKDSITVKKNAPAFANLSAGVHKLVFEFDVPGKNITRELDLKVYPAMKIVPTRYVQGSGEIVKLTSSDKCDGLLGGTAQNSITWVPSDMYSYDAATGTYSIKGQYFDNLPLGTYYLGLAVAGESVLGAIAIAPAPSLKLNEVNDSLNEDGIHEWENNGGGLSFDVSPNVQTVYIQGIAVPAKNYSVNDKNVLTLKYGFLNSLEYGTYKIMVTTSDGDTNELYFKTKCGIAPKNGDSHTKGGRKNLDFVCSEPIKTVIVGSETLKADQYSLSKDGKTLTLKADFMNKLRADRTFKLTVQTVDGDYCSTFFRVLSPGAASSTPKTGDESGIMIWAAVLVLSGIGAVALIPRKKNQ